MYVDERVSHLRSCPATLWYDLHHPVEDIIAELNLGLDLQVVWNR